MSRLVISLFLGLGVTVGACTVEMDDGNGPDTTAATVDTSAAAPDTLGDAPVRSDTTSTAPIRVTGARLLPVDEAAQDPSFFAFRHRMLEAVGARDTTFLYDQMDDGIRISFGADGGKDGFREMWNPAHPESEVWEILGRVLGGGGLLEEGEVRTAGGRSAVGRFQAPYYTAAFPGREYDPFQHGVIIGSDVPVREEPSASAAAIDTLSFDIVPVPNFMPYETEDGDWVRVGVGGGSFGYVPEPLIRSPIGYRAVFNKLDGRWLMTALVAGD